MMFRVRINFVDLDDLFLQITITFDPYVFHYFGEIDPLLWINRQHTSNYFYIIIDHSHTNTSTTQTSLL